MSVNAIEREFREKVSAKLRLQTEGIDRYRVFAPSNLKMVITW